MDLGSMTIKDLLVKKYGDETATQILSELQDGIDQNLPAEELQRKAKLAADKGGEQAVAAM